MTVESPIADLPADESSRLQRFWNRRYQQFVLSESGWSGAGEPLNQRIYACKRQAVRRAVASLHLPSSFAILDAGCGQGYFARMYRDEYPAASYTGVDISSRVVDHLRRALPGVHFEAGDLCNWRHPSGAKFDLIQTIDVFQMILDDSFAIRMIANLSEQLTDRGALIATVSFPDESIEPAPYLRHRTRQFWTSALASCGLRIVREAPMYFWLPAGGPSNKYLRFALASIGPLALYLTDRAAVACRLPQPPSSPLDNRTRLLTVQRMTQ